MKWYDKRFREPAAIAIMEGGRRSYYLFIAGDLFLLLAIMADAAGLVFMLSGNLSSGWICLTFMFVFLVSVWLIDNKLHKIRVDYWARQTGGTK